MKEIQKESTKTPEQGHTIAKSPFELIRGLFRKKENVNSLEQIVVLCSRLPEGPIMDPRNGYRIMNDDSTTEISTELIGKSNPYASRLKIERNAEGEVEGITHVLFPEDDKGTIAPIEKVFNPASPELSTLDLGEVVDSLQEANRRAPLIVRG